MDEKIIDPIQDVIDSNSVEEIRTSIKRRININLLFVTCSTVLLGMFWVRIFTGSIDPWTWEAHQWLLGAVAVSISGLIAYSEWDNWTAGYLGWKTIALTVLLVFFSWFAESAQTMERSQHSAVQQSQDSAMFSSVQESISSLVQSPTQNTGGSAALASAKAKEAEIEAKIENKNRCQSCVPESFATLRSQLAAAKGRIAAAEVSATAQSSEKSMMLNQLIASGNAIEGNEKFQFVMIKFLKGLFGSSIESAMFFFATLLILTFQACYWFSGMRLRVYKAALVRLEGGSSELRPETQNTTSAPTAEKPKGTQGNAKSNSKPLVPYPFEDVGYLAMKEVWREIAEGNITSITTRRPGEIFDFLTRANYGRNNQERLDLVAFVIDGLAKEGVIIQHPDWKEGESNGNRPQYIVAPDVVGNPPQPKINHSFA